MNAVYILKVNISRLAKYIFTYIVELTWVNNKHVCDAIVMRL